MGINLGRVRFSEVDLSDSFFDSLKSDYSEFSDWFQRKSGEDAYVLTGDEGIVGFLYLKIEDGEAQDVTPILPAKRRLKIGTFKVEAHGTKLGERFIKKAIDHALSEDVKEIYTTIFSKHEALVSLLKEYGFKEKGVKVTSNGEELLLVKELFDVTGDLRKDYPIINSGGNSEYLLSIYPQWHTKLFPDSILDNETYDVVQDVSHTNSIQKTYICFMDLAELRSGDIIIIYRTKDSKGSAWYRSVVTSVCTVEEVRNKADFEGIDDYIKYAEIYSVFSKEELIRFWNKGQRLYVVKMLYNAALSKRVIRKDLIEKVDLNGDAYFGFLKLTETQYSDILSLGGVNERIIVN